MSAAGPASRLRPTLGWACLAALLLYVLLIHHGVGPAPDGPHRHWWQPTSFLLEAIQTGPLYFLVEPPLRGVGVGMLPALGLVLALALGTRSALARTLGLAAALACLLFLFYGLRQPGPGIWRFFGWRGSLAMCGLAAIVAAAAASPLLAASWLRLRPAPRIALYALVLAGGVLLLRDVTGTNPSLPFAISPWPVVPFFGVERAVPIVAALLGCVALGLAAWAHRARRAGLALGGVAAALGLPVGGAELLPARGSIELAAALALAGTAALLALAARRRGEAPGATPALRVALGILLLALPVLAGEALAARDWAVTRGERAGEIIDALARYYAREQLYPDSLQDLVRAKDLPAVPRPRIGSGMLGAPRFSYQSFGTSYLLEFSAPGWVQCAYSPPYTDDEDADGGPPAQDGAAADDARPASGGGDDDRQAGAWSCPSKPPELW